MTPPPSIIDRKTEPRGEDEPTGRRAGASGYLGLLRTVVAGFLVGIVLYAFRDRVRRAVSRATEALGRTPPTPVETLRDRADDVAGEASPIPIRSPGDEIETVPSRAPDAEPGDLDEPDEPEPVHEDAGTDAVSPDEGGDEGDGRSVKDDDALDPSADDTVEYADRSPAELDRLATDEPQEDPAEPGEMTVDEEIVEDLVDEDESADADDPDEEG